MFNFPLFEISWYINIGGFLTGFQSIALVVWMCYNYISLMIFSFPPIIGVAQLLKLKDDNIIIILVVIAVSVFLTYIPSNNLEMVKLDVSKNTYVLFPFIGLLLVTCLVAKVRKMGKADTRKPT